MRSLCRFLLAFSSPLLLAGVIGPVTADEPPLDFNRHIRPILSDACFKCHGFDDKTRMADLRLDTAEGAMAKLESGAVAVVPGKLGESELVRRITSTDAGERMPPEGSGKSLSPQQIELLKKWVGQGAPYKQHWSFITPQRQAPPEVAKHKDAVRNPIDQFILARLEQEKLGPSPAADKVTLLRRVTLDLTGLPPTTEEVDAFVADESPEAYEKVVDRLLKSPRYGEHMARYWLDAARYGDTHGLHLDNERSMWPYRDWVVGAFNSNLPFDQFTVWQIAGDLLPGSTLEQKIASGFNRCNVSTSEGGSINEEVRVRYAVDRTETMSTVFLGLTLGCAVCHTHKFDPVTQKEFYQLYAFFNSAADAAMDGNQLSPPPIMKLMGPEQQSQLKSLEEQLAALKKQIGEKLASIEYVDPQAEKLAAASDPSEPREVVWIDDAAPAGAQLAGDSPWKFISKDEGPVLSGDKASMRKAPALSQHFFTGAKPGLKIGEGDKLFAYVYLDPQDPPKEIMLQWNDGSWEHRCYWGEDAIAWGEPLSPSRQPMGKLPQAGEWVRLEVEASKVGLNSGAVVNGWAFTQFGGTVYWDKAGLVTRTPQSEDRGFESLAAWITHIEKQKKDLPKEILDIVKVAADKRKDEQKAKLREHFLQRVYPATKPQFDALSKQLDDLTKKKTDLDAAIPTSLVMADEANKRETFVLIRGAYDKPGDKVTPNVPACLPPLPEGAPADRLGLARWLVDPQHPLTARVTVNRFWQQYFGTGIVKTAEDFGSQGAWPSHPELLDWLARDFIDSGWDVKRLQKLIVMSGTYRQSSRITKELLARDPANELLARGPRFRLDAEVIRDSALFASGLLVEKAGGKGVKPYQPEGIWEAVGFRSSNTVNYKQDTGDALHRRTLYTFWKRTAAPPSLMTLDAPSREACVVRRSRTNTPLQALLLMNDVQYIEAARKLAERVLLTQARSASEGTGAAEPGTRSQEPKDKAGATAGLPSSAREIADQLSLAFRLATSRQPTPDELAILTETYQAHLAKFQANKPAAEKLVAIGESKRDPALDPVDLAARTMVCNLILNLDEVVTKE
ncbi:MAG: PSD1 and planctomycete cytochrome C domain-containing protein [Pirellulaceae bacterium]|nr:PSD1 and planctomycete cytochrome C domain-containing protein [Pirellulaceae bacterium]